MNKYEREAFCHDSKWNYSSRNNDGFVLSDEKVESFLRNTLPAENEILRVAVERVEEAEKS